MQQVFDLIRLAAPSKSNILILGDSGTGKELVAKAIHHNSKRRNGPFVTVNSGSMPADLLESQPVRPRQGLVHRRHLQQEGPVRARQRRLDLLRRDRQHPARDPGQAAARDPGEGVHAPGRRRGAQGRRPHHRRHQRQPRGAGASAARSARTSTTASTSSPSISRRCASGPRTSRCSPTTSSRPTRARTRRRSARSRPARCSS